MEFSTHGNGNGLNDLYALPEDRAEFEAVRDYLQLNDISYTTELSDVREHSWYGGIFFNLPFGESRRAELVEVVSSMTGGV